MKIHQPTTPLDRRAAITSAMVQRKRLRGVVRPEGSAMTTVGEWPATAAADGAAGRAGGIGSMLDAIAARSCPVGSLTATIGR